MFDSRENPTVSTCFAVLTQTVFSYCYFIDHVSLIKVKLNGPAVLYLEHLPQVDR